MRSCLRIVDAPSIPISSDMETSSAGVFFFKSFKCIRQSFLGELGSSFSMFQTKPEAAGRRFSGRTGRRRAKQLAEESSAIEVCILLRPVNQPSPREAAERSERTDN